MAPVLRELTSFWLEQERDREGPAFRDATLTQPIVPATLEHSSARKAALPEKSCKNRAIRKGRGTRTGPGPLPSFRRTASLSLQASPGPQVATAVWIW
jgi:hypothetical protein